MTNRKAYAAHLSQRVLNYLERLRSTDALAAVETGTRDNFNQSPIDDN